MAIISNAESQKRYRESMRGKGYKPMQIWVKDTTSAKIDAGEALSRLQANIAKIDQFDDELHHLWQDLQAAEKSGSGKAGKIYKETISKMTKLCTKTASSLA